MDIEKKVLAHTRHGLFLDISRNVFFNFSAKFAKYIERLPVNSTKIYGAIDPFEYDDWYEENKPTEGSYEEPDFDDNGILDTLPKIKIFETERDALVHYKKSRFSFTKDEKRKKAWEALEMENNLCKNYIVLTEEEMIENWFLYNGVAKNITINCSMSFEGNSKSTHIKNCECSSSSSSSSGTRLPSALFTDIMNSLSIVGENLFEDSFEVTSKSTIEPMANSSSSSCCPCPPCKGGQIDDGRIKEYDCDPQEDSFSVTCEAETDSEDIFKYEDELEKRVGSHYVFRVLSPYNCNDKLNGQFEFDGLNRFLGYSFLPNCETELDNRDFQSYIFWKKWISNPNFLKSFATGNKYFPSNATIMNDLALGSFFGGFSNLSSMSYGFEMRAHEIEPAIKKQRDVYESKKTYSSENMGKFKMEVSTKGFIRMSGAPFKIRILFGLSAIYAVKTEKETKYLVFFELDTNRDPGTYGNGRVFSYRLEKKDWQDDSFKNFLQRGSPSLIFSIMLTTSESHIYPLAWFSGRANPLSNSDLKFNVCANIDSYRQANTGSLENPEEELSYHKVQKKQLTIYLNGKEYSIEYYGTPDFNLRYNESIEKNSAQENTYSFQYGPCKNNIDYDSSRGFYAYLDRCVLHNLNIEYKLNRLSFSIDSWKKDDYVNNVEFPPKK